MKIKYHIPTEQFGFVEVEGEVETLEDAVPSYDALRGLNVPDEGLDHKEWIKALDGYMATHSLSSSVYEDMNREQQGVLQELKKHYKRLKAKE